MKQYARLFSCWLLIGGLLGPNPARAADITLAARKDIVVAPPPKDEIAVPEQYRGIHRVTPNQYYEISEKPEVVVDESYDADFTAQYRGGFLHGWRGFLESFQNGDFDLDETTDPLRSPEEFVGAFSVNAPNAFNPGRMAGMLACRDGLLALAQKRTLAFLPVRTSLAKKLLALGAVGPGLTEDGNPIQVSWIRGSKGRKIQDEDLNVLREVSLANLTRLNLPATSITDAGVANLPPMPQLTELEIGGANLTGTCLRTLTRFPELVGLAVVGPLTIKAVDFAAIQELSGLQSIGLREVEIEDDVIPFFLTLPSLTRLQFEWAYEGPHRPKLSSRAIAKLSGCKRLNGLSLRGYDVDDAALEAIASGLHELQVLYLDNTLVTDESVGSIQKLSKLVWLNLAHTRVSDAGIVALASHPSLKALMLMHTRVSDRAFVTLATLPNLRDIFLHRGQVSPTAIIAFRKVRPDIHVTLYN